MKKLCYFLIGVIVISSAVGAELQSFYKSKFSGLNNSVNVRLLQDDEAYDMSNFSLDEIGSIKERDLFGQYNSLSGALGSNYITGLFKHYTTDAKYFFACAGDNIGLGSGGTFTDISPTNSTVIASSFYSGVSFNNRFYLFNPKDEPFVYTGSGNFHKLDNSSAIPSANCAYSAVHKSRVWAARPDLYPYRLYWSSLNNAENWTVTGGYADLPDINQEIKGIISWGGYLYIFTETNIYVLLGSTPNDFSLRKTNSMVGAIAPRSIVITDIGIMFLARSGVYAFDGNNSTKTSVKIDGSINGISKTLIQNACAVYDGRRYWLSYTLSGGSYNNDVILYDTELKEWYQYRGSACNINYFVRAFGGTDKGELYGGSSTTNGIVYSLQSSVGTESVTHSTREDFDNNVTFNTVTTDTPSVKIRTFINLDSVLLSHFNGVDGATAYTAETGQAFTFTGTAQLDTATKAFGTSSLLLDGNSDYVTLADDSDYYFAGSDFTIEWWARWNNLAGSQAIFSQTDGGANNWKIRKNADNTIQMVFNSTAGSKGEFITTAALGLAANTWYHFAFVRSGTTAYLFWDGTSQALTVTNAWGTLPDYTDVLKIGYDSDTGAYHNGWIDEVHIENGTAKYTSNFTSNTYEYSSIRNGIMTSQGTQINTSGTSSLGNIVWTETLPSNSKITFQTRTGVTNDSVYFNGWQYWSSANSVTFNTVTDATVIFTSSDSNLKVQKPSTPQTRNILYYEDEDDVSPSSAQFQVFGAVSTDKYAEAYLPVNDLSSYDWLSGWYKSPATGNSVELSIGKNTVNKSITFNTVSSNTWEKWYWYIGGMTDLSGINRIRYTYRGDVAGNIICGGISAYNFYESGDTMSSTPNDWIQYRAILWANGVSYSPELNSVTLIYSPTSGSSETSLSSYYYTKWYDFKTPQLNKQFDSLIIEANSTTSSSVTLYCDYDIDFGLKTGTFSFPITTTANTVRLYKSFPSSVYGKAIRFKLYNDDDATVTIKGLECRYRLEKATPD